MCRRTLAAPITSRPIQPTPSAQAGRGRIPYSSTVARGFSRIWHTTTELTDPEAPRAPGSCLQPVHGQAVFTTGLDRVRDKCCSSLGDRHPGDWDHCGLRRTCMRMDLHSRPRQVDQIISTLTAGVVGLRLRSSGCKQGWKHGACVLCKQQPRIAHMLMGWSSDCPTQDVRT